MKILVTGGAGFIGSHIVDKYIDLGHQVVVIDNLVTGFKKFINLKAKFYKVDICDREAVEKVFTSEKPELINHHAAQMDVRKSVADPKFDAETNIIGLLNLLQAGKTSGVKKVIFASTGGAVYGDTQVLPTPETYCCRPVSPYGISKLTSEHYLDFYANNYGTSYIALRYSNVYGPRQNPHGEAGVVAIFMQKLLKGEQPKITRDGKQSRDFVFVADVVAANIAALTYTENLIVNIGTGIGTSINELYDKIQAVCGTSFPKTYIPKRPGEQQVSVLDINLAKEKLNWQPISSLDDGLKLTADYFKNEK